MRGAIIAGAMLFIASGWPTQSHDVRRTGQSDVRGPRAVERVDSFLLTGEQSVNMPVAVADDGTVYAGTWGMVHTRGTEIRTQWDKFDGKLFAFDRKLTPRWTARLDHVPYCYAFGARPDTPPFCPTETLNGYNGTVEGTTTIDAARGQLYVGRGDGKLYAIDAGTGSVVWRFAAFNPNDPADPEGGGEVVAGPLVATDGTIYFATVGVGDYETSAIYAVAPNGSLRWRYPESTASLPQVIWAAPALSPDGKTLYVGGGWGPTADDWDVTLPGTVYALNAANGTLKWTFNPVNTAEWWKPTVWTTELAVGTDGTIYAAGTESTFGGGSAVLFALRDRGNSATYAWPRMVDLDRGQAILASGLALRESGGVTRRVYATSVDPYSVLSQSYTPGGELVAVDAANGNVLWRFDPEAHGGTGSMSGIAIDADGVVYTGVSGATAGGRVFAIRDDGSLLFQFPLGGLLEWAHPVIGPFGDLYVADTRRCIWMDFPVESGLCSAFDVNPRVYAIGGDPRRRAARH
jgi:outer membrane protein assembly factor BamB